MSKTVGTELMASNLRKVKCREVGWTHGLQLRKGLWLQGGVLRALGGAPVWAVLCTASEVHSLVSRF